MSRGGRPSHFKKKRMKPQMTRIKTVWITEPSAKPFLEQYRLGRQIGEAGQFGKAFRCQRMADGRVFAVKQISKARFYRLDTNAKKRQALLASMKGEIDIMKRLKHKYIVNMIDVFEDKHTLWIVMEECKGGELFDRITERRRFPEPDAAKVVKMMLEALYYMHDLHRVVHCDLKPDNILFVSKDEESPIKIIDFGMSKVLPRLRSLRELVGTPYYTAPEIIDGNYAHEADCWSIGVIMFVTLFGYPPFYVNPNKYFGKAEAEAIYALIRKGFDPVVKKGYGPWFPKRFPVSPEARDLMTRLILTDRSARLNAREALLHPWIRSLGITDFWKEKLERRRRRAAKKAKKVVPAPISASAATVDDSKVPEDTPGPEETPVPKEMLGEFANFANNSNFKLAVIQLFRSQFEKMRPAHFKQLKEVFKALDKDDSGSIDYNEFETGMLQMNLNLSRNQIREMFKELDVKSAGEIHFEELVNAAVHDYLVSSDERLYKAFRELDKDDDGIITIDEMKAQLKIADPYGRYEDLLKVIDDANLNQDGLISYESFLRALHPSFNEQPEWFAKALHEGKPVSK